MQEAGIGTTTDGIQEKLVAIRRTAKVVRGGRVFGFSAIVVAGDGDGKVGFGLGKAREVPSAIQKATGNARRNMIFVPLYGATLHHAIKATHASSTVLMLPASEGTGVIAGNAMRAIFEVMGVQNVLAKCIGSSNPINVVRATFKGLKQMETPESVAAKRGKAIEEIVE
ncbi:30S ribosomal protein S5 [Coxiella endosymbiont of Ornithodoros amblus]|uniref:30S ribosomal protein S5 n=1 Tax=Coxiella endosymbiont of Ornithodoros amblus TaxID=1656166 RepID=UPI00244E11F7|nr:30S ribosomal protein S5 [Coxiella endosymbiont of Ornithodoros amblus]MBW5802534.1 30S ribosomal protein S5 [Coxiella endosymbiont of Ornithodoros amblus]